MEESFAAFRSLFCHFLSFFFDILSFLLFFSISKGLFGFTLAFRGDETSLVLRGLFL